MQRTKILGMMKALSGVLLSLAAHTASADIVPFSGTFAQDDDIAWLDFMLNEDTSMKARTTSFAAGGFAPVLSLFSMGKTSDLLSIAYGSSNTCSTPGAGSPSGGLCWDAFFNTVLSSGSYRLVVSQIDNLPNGLGFADGFSQTGNPTYTGANYLGDPSQFFINLDGTQRNGNYAGLLQLTPIPEPAPFDLLLLGLIGMTAALAYRPKAKENLPPIRY